MERYFVVKKSSALRVSSETKTSDSKTTTKTKRYQPYADARREHASGSSSSSRTPIFTETTTRTQSYARTREVSSLSPPPTRHDDDDNHDYDNNNDDHNDHDIDNANVNADVTDLKNLSTKDLTHLVLSTLSHRSNPITHSDIYERTEHIVSAASGHQRGDGRVNGGHKAWFDHRSSKLNEQRNAEAMRTASSSASTSLTTSTSTTSTTSTSSTSATTISSNNTNGKASGNSKASVLKGVRVYINGYLRNTTDIEMKRIVIGAGGSILLTPSGATHILTSQQLSGSKTHKILTAKNSKRSGHVQVHVVRPEWVMDSIAAGRKVREVDYAVVRDGSMRRIEDMFGGKM
ncbi:hypothetical protein ONZ45_g12572 [Pleurotus djamor]|nr:hypothetical protein ONZ45_g12572 [Pleurotus djamor]